MACKCKCKGAVSSKGPRGLQGPAGANGSSGSNGLNGSNGAPGAQGPAGPNVIVVSFGSADVLWTNTSSASYVDLGRFVFEGTTFHTATPTKITVMARLDQPVGGNNDRGQIRLYDETAAAAIGATGVTDVNTNSWALYDIPITGSFSAAQAILAIQGKMSGVVDANSIYIASVSIRF